MVWEQQPFFRSAREKYGKIRGIPDIRCYFLQSCLRSLDHLDGDVAECGVFHGRSSLFMTEATRPDRRFFLFDSFEGLSDPTPGKDTLETVYRKGDVTRMFHNENLDQVLSRFARFGERMQVFQGWIPDRFQEVADQRFCLVHVDVDMYQPTLDALEFFYERLASGGIIVCDDYGSGAYPGARQAMDEFFESRPETPIELPQGQAFIIKR